MGEEAEEEEERYEVGALRKGMPWVKCYRCGGAGHMAKECTTPYDAGDQGKGKGKKGGGKGYGKKGGGKAYGGYEKGGYKGGGKKGGGKGKGGYQGTCWVCGQVGHKQGEACCPGGVGVNAAEMGGDVDLGAVTLGGGSVEWLIAAVEVEEEGEWQTQKRTQKKAIRCPVGWGAEFGTRVAEEWQKMRLVNAGGGVIPHIGSRRVTFKESVFEGRVEGE